MTIVETKKLKRISTSTPFFTEANSAELASVNAGVQAIRNAGRSTYTRTVSNDGLIETMVTTYDSLATFGEVDTLKTPAMDLAFLKYVATGFEQLGVDQYKLEGVDTPFIHTIRYSYNAGAVGVDGVTTFEQIISKAAMSYDSRTPNKLQNIEVHPDSVIITLRYENAADYTATYFNDLGYILEIGPGLNRTLAYTAV